jgi:uncharacterized protein (UPF0264 family)
MTGLLVSVRSAAEAAIALEAGVQVLDVKEPSRGPLGRADASVIEDILRLTSGRVPVSAALGELAEWILPPASRLPPPASCLLPGLSFAKIGLAGTASFPDWRDAWSKAMAPWPCGTVRVAVAYADWEVALAAPPTEVLENGHTLGCRAALLDTHDKHSGGLFDHLPQAQVAKWIERASDLGMLAVVAGSLDIKAAPRAAALQPDLIAVRGAVCRGGREGAIDAARILALRQALAKTSPSPAPSTAFYLHSLC